jgi:hypothetical protein
VLPDFYIPGGKELNAGSPIDVFKDTLEKIIKEKWNKPENLEDDKFVALVDITVGRDGTLSNPQYRTVSGNTAWDNTVRAAIAAVPRVTEKVPTNFPPRVTIKFDVAEETTESVFP